MRAALRREALPDAELDLSDIQWILPSRALTDEVERVLDAGCVRGADCWHLACALYLAQDSGEVTFLTLDLPQRKVAKALGFAT